MKVVISGIGTGGHYFPALVVAREFMKRSVSVIFLARNGQYEESLARNAGIPVYCIDPKGFYGVSVSGKVLSGVSILVSVLAVRCLTRQAIGISFGGYGSIPLIIACIFNRCPYYLFEPNRIPGRATTLFARKARGVFLGLPPAKSVRVHGTVTGIPIRHEFKNVRASSAEKKNKKRILLLGGSQGARRLNDLGVALQSRFTNDYEITIISGKRDYQRMKTCCADSTRVIPFTDTPWVEMKNADVIVSRSGALAGYEIMSLGKPVIFIPFPYAIDDHQYYNAEYFAQIGNAVVMRENEVDEQCLAEAIQTMMQKKESKSTLNRDAEKQIASVIMEENG